MAGRGIGELGILLQVSGMKQEPKKEFMIQVQFCVIKRYQCCQ